MDIVLVMILDEKAIGKINYFNQTAEKVINSKFKHEFIQKVEELLSFKDEYDIYFKNRSKDEDFLNTTILPIGNIFNNESSISIDIMYNLYNNLEINEAYKISFKAIVDVLNEFLDETATTFLKDMPSKRVVFETIMYNEFPYFFKQMPTHDSWKNDEKMWNLVFIEFQRIMYDLIGIVQSIYDLNINLLKFYKIIS